MRASRLRSFSIALLLLLSAAVMLADVTYTYTGNYFSVVQSPYTTNDRITGYLTVSSPLPPNSDYNSNITPNYFSLSDGIQTITSSNNNGIAAFGFGTDGSGNIVWWNIDVYLGGGGIQTYSIPPAYGLLTPFDGVWYTDINNEIFGLGINYAGGTWAATPEPGTLAMIGTGAAGLAGLLRRKLMH